jgi:hypothetical protein
MAILDQEADQNQHYSPREFLRLFRLLDECGTKRCSKTPVAPTPSINDIEREPIRDSPDPSES